MSRRRRLSLGRGVVLALLAGAAAFGVGAIPTGAVGAVGAVGTSPPLLHDPPSGPAAVRFPTGFAHLVDHEWGFALGGFGGALPDDAASGVHPSASPGAHAPVVFVHGNTVDAADWYPVRDAFIAAGWNPDDLWALSYNGLGANSGSAGGTANPRRDAEHAAAGGDGVSRSTDHETFADNPRDLADFIDAVLAFRGASRFSIVGHSLGVTEARRTLERRPDLAARTVAFVGIAGANHGTSLCAPGSEGRVVSCDEIAAGTPWLAARNAAPDEVSSAEVMTLRDGTGGADVAFVGPSYAGSPSLGDVAPWAFDCAYGRGHNDLRLNTDPVRAYRLFIEAAEAGRVDRGVQATTGVPVVCGAVALPGLSSAGIGAPPGVTPPVTVPELPVPAGAVVLAAAGLAVVAARRHRRAPLSPSTRY